MKNFQDYVTESFMTVSDAMREFGFSGSYTQDELKSKYRKLAILKHPDKGGDLEGMQKLNAAYEILQSTTGSPSSHMTWEERRERDKMFGKIALSAIRKKLDAEAFTNFFSEIFSDSFVANVTEKSDSYGASVSAQWSNKDQTTVLDLNIYVSFGDLYRGNSLAQEDHGLTMTLNRSIYHNRRKVKLAQNTYSFDTDYTVLHEPERLFPRDKLVTKKDKEAERKISKRDIVLAFHKELSADSNGNDFWVPLQGGYKLHIYRHVMMRQGGWMFGGLYQKSKRVAQLPFTTFLEQEDTISWLIDELKAVQRIQGEEKILKALNDIAAEHKARR